MATVEGITVEKALEIQNASVVSGAINPTNGHLILTTGGGTTVDAGAVVPSGLAHLTGSETLSGKTLITPTIGSLVNAQHSHLDPAGGGTLPVGAIPDIGSTDSPAPVTSLTQRTLSDADSGTPKNLANIAVSPGRWLIIAVCEGVTLPSPGDSARFSYDLASDVGGLVGKPVSASSSSQAIDGGRAIMGWVDNSNNAVITFTMRKNGSGALITTSTTGMLMAVRFG